MPWLDSKGWAERAAEGKFVPSDIQVLLDEIETLRRDCAELLKQIDIMIVMTDRDDCWPEEIELREKIRNSIEAQRK